MKKISTVFGCTSFATADASTLNRLTISSCRENSAERMRVELSGIVDYREADDSAYLRRLLDLQPILNSRKYIVWRLTIVVR